MILPPEWRQYDNKTEATCPRCQCKYESRNTTIIKVRSSSQIRCELPLIRDLMSLMFAVRSNYRYLGDIIVISIHDVPNMLGSFTEQSPSRK